MKNVNRAVRAVPSTVLPGVQAVKSKGRGHPVMGASTDTAADTGADTQVACCVETGAAETWVPLRNGGVEIQRVDERWGWTPVREFKQANRSRIKGK